MAFNMVNARKKLKLVDNALSIYMRNLGKVKDPGTKFQLEMLRGAVANIKTVVEDMVDNFYSR